MDDNNTSEELPLDGGGDIEQGGSAIIPENTDSVWSSEAAAITPPPSKWTLGGLEEAEEDAAAVPLVEHIAGMGIIKKDDIRASDSASLPRPPTQDVRPTVMKDDSQRHNPSEYVTFESNADDEFNRRLLAKAAMAVDLKAETKRSTVMEDDSSRPTPSSDSAAFASNADNEFNRRLLAKSAMAVDSEEENMNPHVIDDGSQHKPYDSAAFESNADDEFNRRLLAKSAMAAASKGDDMRPPVIDVDSQSRPFGSNDFGDEGSKKITAAPQPPILHAMKQVEDGDDAAPRSFNSAEFVSSSIDGQTEAAGGAGASSVDDNGSIGEDPVVHEMNEHPSPGDEENNLQRLVGSPVIHSTSDYEETRQVVPSAAETHPSLPILEAYLVEEEEGSDDIPLLTTSVATLPPGNVDTVYEATPVKPWWKQRRTKVFMMIIFVLTIAMAAGLGAVLSRSIPIAEVDNSSNDNNTATSYKCFADRNELKIVVDRYVKDGCGKATILCTGISNMYRWPIGSWCVGSVTNMSELFKDLGEFNEDISEWEVGQVTDMSHMFRRASSFNQEDLSNWDTSAVTTMEAMFSEASAFDGNIASWNTSAVTTMRSMFNGAFSFNQEDLSRWDTSAVTTMYAMFDSALAFNGNISSWNTSAVTDMSYMFSRASSFNREDLSKWDTSAVTTMEAMFVRASAFNGNISSWNTSAVTAMNHMFWRASSFNQEDLSKWDTSAVTDMRVMFNLASAFNGNISSWNTSAVTNMRAMFKGATSFNQNLCSWKDNFPYDIANEIFLNSGCTFPGEPQVVQQGPFCAASCADNE